MTIANAKEFIKRGMRDQELRDRLNGALTVDELYRTLGENELVFSPEELEEAYSNGLTLCQFEEQADRLKEFRMWWDLLHRFLSADSRMSTGGCPAGTQCSAVGNCAGCDG